VEDEGGRADANRRRGFLPSAFSLLPSHLPPCPVCLSHAAKSFATAGGRDYRRCAECEATFLDPAQFPDAEAERERYLLHRNDPADAGYRDFLGRLVVPLLAKLAARGRCEGLDYGCGPGPASTLAGMLEACGHSVALYDPFFRDDRSALERTYDFIACSEAAEHFHRPAEEFARLDALLRPGGWLGVMTCLLADDVDFERWHYRQDLTHVVFYREATFRRIAERHGWACEFPVRDVVLMRRVIAE